MISESYKLIIRIIKMSIHSGESKEDLKVGCAVISDNRCNIQRIPDGSSIFIAEAIAVDLTLRFY